MLYCLTQSPSVHCNKHKHRTTTCFVPRSCFKNERISTQRKFTTFMVLLIYKRKVLPGFSHHWATSGVKKEDLAWPISQGTRPSLCQLFHAAGLASHFIIKSFHSLVFTWLSGVLSLSFLEDYKFRKKLTYDISTAAFCEQYIT